MTVYSRGAELLEKVYIVLFVLFHVSSDLMEMCKLLTCEEILLSITLVVSFIPKFLQPQSPPQPCRAACSILVPGPGIEPMPPAMRGHVLTADHQEIPLQLFKSVSFPDHNNLEVFSNLSSEHGNMHCPWSLFLAISCHLLENIL